VSRRRALIPALISILVLASVVAALAVHHQQQNTARANALKEATARVEGLRSQLKGSIGRLNGLVGLLSTQRVTQDEFQSFSRPLLNGEPALDAISFQQKVEGDERRAFERTHGPIVEQHGPRLVPAPQRNEYTVVANSATQDSTATDFVNVEANPARAEALNRATNVAAASATNSLKLYDRAGKGFVIYLPIYRGGIVPNAVNDRRERVTGFAVGVLRSTQLARQALLESGPGMGYAVSENRTEVLDGGDLGGSTVSQSVQLANQRWTVTAAVAAPSLLLPALIVVGGILLAIFTALTLATLLSSEQIAKRLADRRVAELDLAQRALEESERHYRLLAENSSDFVARHTADGRFVYASPASQSMVGYAPEELIGRLNWEYIHPEDVPRMREVYGGFLGGANLGRVETRFKRKDGQYIWLESSVRSVRDPRSGAIVETHVSHRDVSERKRLEKELRELADQDPLTGLRNRRSFTQELERELASIERYGGEATLVLIDVDDLKGTNDTYGHAAGDSVLIGLSETTRSRLRESDLIARLGGDEFAAVLRNTGPDAAREVAESVLLALQTQAIDVEGATLAGIRVSMGLATFGRWSATTAEGLISRADKALYQAKGSAHDRVVSISIGLDDIPGN
jgi:diguanylate cyclase (GGDEF)-like protein/PAS domain S-box-containing protein